MINEDNVICYIQATLQPKSLDPHFKNVEYFYGTSKESCIRCGETSIIQWEKTPKKQAKGVRFC